ncbi:MAG: FHA domain-containing protein [Candidatus Melainabacteria bacterium]|jgi:pSer/pThr/pTyr-binding forkhead associated (FHA) protein|nr:FHA domain-containing protein [Candidatus Melainabacteria bacterium]
MNGSETMTNTPTGRLPVLVNMESGEKHTLDNPNVTIGRSPDCGLVLSDDDYASGEHARIYFDQGRWWLEDTMSSNGTSVNGQMINSVYQLMPNDVLKFGRTTFRIE